MDESGAVNALGALAQEHRLRLFRLLVRAGRGGMPAGAIAERLGVPNSSLSFHLTQLQRAELIAVERQGRSLVYRADFAAMDRLVAFLMENCCADESCAAPTQSQGEQA